MILAFVKQNTNCHCLGSRKQTNKLVCVYTRYLRSQSQHLLSVPKSGTVTYGDRAFSVCAPKLWNELPFQLRMSTNIQAFKSGLKTMLFKMAYF